MLLKRRNKKARVDFSVSHDGENWIVCNERTKFSGKSLQEIDAHVHDYLVQSNHFPQGTTVQVFMGFDYETIPRWIRQYAAHYFNRRLTIKI